MHHVVFEYLLINASSKIWQIFNIEHKIWSYTCNLYYLQKQTELKLNYATL